MLSLLELIQLYYLLLHIFVSFYHTMKAFEASVPYIYNGEYCDHI